MHISATSMPSGSRHDMDNLRELVPYLWKFRWRVALALLSLIIAKVAAVGVPMVLKEIVDSLEGVGLSNKVSEAAVLPLALLLGYGGLRAVNALFNELRDAIFARARHGITRTLSLEVMRHLHALSLRFHLDRKTGGISRDIERGTRSVNSLMNMLLFNIIPTSVEILLVATVLLANYDPWYAVVILVTLLFYILFTTTMTSWRMKFRVKMNAKDSEANSRAIDALINYETVKYFGNEELEIDRYDEQLKEWETAAVGSQTSMSALSFGQALIIAIGVTIVMIMAGKGVVTGEITLGDLVMINTFILQLFIPLGFLGVIYSQVQHSLSDMSHMFKLLKQPPEITDIPEAVPVPTTPSCIEFKNVNFSYDPDREILHEINLTVQHGKKVAVVGTSGSGKSTLARLLYRFYDISQGELLINNIDIKQLQQHSLRCSIGIVPQDTVLFNDTLFYNIQYANPSATKEDIVAAAKIADLDKFISSLTNGYDTLVGERGLKLSGGEKQRVAIARVVLKNPEILIFDEATSSLDSASERSILNALDRVASKRTTLVIAHRLSTIVDADEIIVMEQGKIIERGTHQQLLADNRHYAKMWQLQLSDNLQSKNNLEPK